MRAYLHICLVLFAGALVCIWLGVGVVGTLIFPVPIAVHWVYGRRAQSMGLVACAAGAALTGQLGVVGVMYYGLIALLGALIGEGITRRWTYGGIVAVVASITYAVLLAQAWVAWDVMQAHTNALFDAWIAQATHYAEKAQGGSKGLVVDQLRWLKEHWSYIGMGVMVWPVLIATCAVVSLTGLRVKRLGADVAPRGTFRRMRTSEWLVWVAIVLAALWFVERQWPHALLRTAIWNTAVGL
ncbi:MAG TPA: DUF2232 domain-containing protein, partial [Candidatus Hydrogenedentes bacterium]|nr:DUF2232 domain-containing protein [Candidatus Hydrogenedentota bacterium]